MKKIYLILLTLLTLSNSVEAEQVTVILTDGRTIEGDLVMYNASLLVIEPNTVVKYEKKLKPKDVIYFEIEGTGRFNSQDDIFVFDEQSQNQYKEQRPEQLADASITKIQSRALPTNPNEVIGKALLTTGGVALGIGLPCLVAGVATCIAGNVNITTSNLVQKANCAEASYYLFGVGASLTIISIPLLVHGRRIADMKFNYNGNGAGVSVAF